MKIFAKEKIKLREILISLVNEIYFFLNLSGKLPDPQIKITGSMEIKLQIKMVQTLHV